MSKEKKTPLDFCYIIDDHRSIPLNQWLASNHYDVQKCGLVNLAHMRDMFVVFYDDNNQLNYRGIIAKPQANYLALSNIEKHAQPVGYLSFNKDGYQTYCKDYREYWEWVSKRNEARYESTRSHGKNYDAKNMMHTFRLLDMAAEIARSGKIVVRVNNRDQYMRIRSGEFSYDELVARAEEKITEIDGLFRHADLPDRPDLAIIKQLHVEIRECFYQSM